MTVCVNDVVSSFSRPDAVGLASRMARIKSYSGNETEIADFTASTMRELGLEVQLQPVAPGRLNVIGTWRGMRNVPSLMYNGHMDTNPAGEGWSRDPLGGYVDEKFVYGIGICNMKSSNASALHAVSMLKRAGFSPAGDLVLAFVIGELQGGVGTAKLIASGLRTDFFIVGEPTDLTVLTRHSASFVFEITVLGRTRHLSKREQGVDAIAQAGKLLPRLRSLVFSGAASDDDRSLNRINVGVIRAGVSRALLDWRPQQLADVCVLKCAGRFGPSQTLAGAMGDLQALLDAMHGEDDSFHAELKLVEDNRIFMPPFKVDPSARPVRAVEQAHLQVTGQPARVGMHTAARFFGSDAAHLAAAGMTGLLYGPGGEYNTMPDERVGIDEIETASKVYACAIADILG